MATSNIAVMFLHEDCSSSSDETCLDTSSSESSSEEEHLSEKRITIKNFVEDNTRRFDNKQFRQHYRISKDTMNILLQDIVNAHIIPTYEAGKENLTPEKSLLMTLWYLANLETCRQISDRFDCARSTALVCIRRVIKYFVNVAHRYIQWPNEDDSNQIIENFKKQQGIPGVIGAIDGCHINIKRPKDHVPYCNRKGVISIVLQGVCDHRKRFLDIFCGEPGSMHDARVLRRSNLYQNAHENGLPFRKHLLADSAYPNLSWLVTPFRDNGNLSPQQRQFNYKHSSTRIVIEHAFGLLKGRFRRLRYFENKDISFIVKCVIAACVLRNICINFDDLEDIEENNEQMVVEEQEDEGNDLGQDTRLEIFNELFHN